MGNKEDSNACMPSVAIAPGETIKENMMFLGMNQKELAARLGITQKHLSNIINGNASITYETALRLETVIGASAQFWLNLEMNYQLTQARLKAQENLDEDMEILKKIPYKAMSDHGWVEKTSDRRERVHHCRNFFGVANLNAVRLSYAVAFRKHKAMKTISDYGVYSWLRKAEIEGLRLDVERFDRSKLKSLIPTFRKLTLEDPEVFYPELVRLCAECGVALVLIRYIPNTSLCGATMWRNNRAILALSNRGKRADIFWFTFFHELAHLLHHQGKEFHINYHEEHEADSEARNYMISEKEYRAFIENYAYTVKTEIVSYSNTLGIAPSILVGRLQHDGYLEPHLYNDLRPLFEIDHP
ncbi:MAG: HigA family addiction module antitoxin [Proteobacteria bacterium]|nr:HigA family addiction module antitoxin [Pseudomonadota bacterium]